MAHAPQTFPHPLYEKHVLQPFFRDAAAHYFAPMMNANRAHAVMLRRCHIISQDNAAALLRALQNIDDNGVDKLLYTAGLEDLFFAVEGRLIALAGTAHGGNLQLARSRNDLGYALTRLALRPMILHSFEHLLSLRKSLHRFAKAHLDTLMPAYTHTQPAQPSTMAHYIAGALSSLERDSARLQFAHQTNNQSPLGAAALTGTGFPIDRHLSARLLGFDGILLSTYDSIAASDNLTDTASALTSIGINLSRFTHDMLFWATQESGAIRIDDSFIQISSIMPQKRNPVVLEHLRARISRLLSLAHGIVIQCHSIPFGDTQDIEDEILPLLFGSLNCSTEICALYKALIDTLQVNTERLRNRAIEGFTTATELADALVRRCQLPFRQAHSIVSALVNQALENQLSPTELRADMLIQIANRDFNLHINLTEQAFKQALDPRSFVEARNTPGGASPTATAQVLQKQQSSIDRDSQWLHETRANITSAQALLQTEVHAILNQPA